MMCISLRWHEEHLCPETRGEGRGRGEGGGGRERGDGGSITT